MAARRGTTDAGAGRAGLRRHRGNTPAHTARAQVAELSIELQGRSVKRGAPRPARSLRSPSIAVAHLAEESAVQRQRRTDAAWRCRHVTEAPWAEVQIRTAPVAARRRRGSPVHRAHLGGEVDARFSIVSYLRFTDAAVLVMRQRGLYRMGRWGASWEEVTGEAL